MVVLSGNYVSGTYLTWNCRIWVAKSVLKSNSQKSAVISSSNTAFRVQKRLIDGRFGCRNVVQMPTIPFPIILETSAIIFMGDTHQFTNDFPVLKKISDVSTLGEPTLSPSATGSRLNKLSKKIDIHQIHILSFQ